MKAIKLAARRGGNNPRHHLWNNNGTWWCQFTVHRGSISERARVSLETRDLGEACRKRDRLFANLEGGMAA